MPLLNISTGRTPRCEALCKRRQARCWNPAAWGCRTCKYHGAKKPSAVIRGADHWNYKHGRETVAARRRRLEAVSRIRLLVELGVRGGFIQRRIPGRRPISTGPKRSKP